MANRQIRSHDDLYQQFNYFIIHLQKLQNSTKKGYIKKKIGLIEDKLFNFQILEHIHSPKLRQAIGEKTHNNLGLVGYHFLVWGKPYQI